jgi:DNA-directed RNA polymerase subunit M/transcription elongation factor TFIIS
MSATKPQLLSVDCPGCGAHYEIPVSMAGRSGSCASCGTKFAVPAAAPTTEADSAIDVEDEEKPSLPQYIAVECRVCQTRMYGRPNEIGKQLKCPDCGARTVVPQPPPPKRKNIPAALEGEQYELWDADEQPLPRQLAAAQPKYIAVRCKHCDTLMYATEDQIGQTIICPDCGKQHVVPPPAKQAARRSVLASEAETPKLDPAAAPGERPKVIPQSGSMLYEHEREAELAAEKEIERRTGKKLRDARGRPILPRQPLLTGVWRMLVTEEIIARWIFLSIILGFAVQFLAEALLTPLQGQVEAIKLIFTVIGGFLLMAWVAMAAPLIVAIVGESADGEDRLNQPPRLLAFDWFHEMFSAVMAGSVAGLCGLGVWQITRLISLEPVMSAVIVTMVVLIVLPVTLLSTLLEGTPLGVLSPRLVSSMGKCPGAWFQFYLQTFVLAALVGGAAWMLWWALGIRPGDEATMLWCLGPLAIAALFIDMRLLGRLAWWISERIPLSEKQDEA